MKLNPVRYYILHGAHPCKILFTTWRLHLENKSYKCVYCMFTLNILLIKTIRALSVTCVQGRRSAGMRWTVEGRSKAEGRLWE